MSDAIQQRVEEFVQEILDLIEQVSAERREEALSAVTALLAGAGQPPTARVSSARRSPPGETSRKAAASPKRGQRRLSATPAPAADAPARRSNRAGRGVGAAGSAGSSGTTASTAAGLARSSAPASDTASQATEREAKVLDAVRDIGNATAGEVAERTGLPNGSVVVALRALVARGLVARTKSERGVEYRLPAKTAVVQ